MLALLSLRRKGARPIFFPFFHFRWVVDTSFVNIYHKGWGWEVCGGGGEGRKKNRGLNGFQGEQTGEQTGGTDWGSAFAIKGERLLQIDCQ